MHKVIMQNNSVQRSHGLYGEDISMREMMQITHDFVVSPQESYAKLTKKTRCLLKFI
jgi:hypothetical protein